MSDLLPTRGWLLILIAAIAFAPAKYVFQHLAAAPSRRDITQPTGDLSWRTQANFTRNMAFLAALTGLAIFIFTPAAERFAQSPKFWPFVIGSVGVWTLVTVVRGFMTGSIEPMSRGSLGPYERETQPKRFWASMAWNALLGGAFVPLPLTALTPSVEDRCSDVDRSYSSQEKLAACNEVLAERRNAGDNLMEPLIERGTAYYRLGDYRHAFIDYSDAVSLDPKNSSALYNRALAYDALGDRAGALADYDAVIKLRPDDADAHFNRGLIFLGTQRFDEAVADFARSHELQPKDAWALANRGMAYAWQNDKVRAEADFRAARARDPKNIVAMQGEVVLALQSGDTDRAINQLNAMLDMDPGDQWALGTRGEVYRVTGQSEKSRADFEKMRRLSQSNARR